MFSFNFCANFIQFKNIIFRTSYSVLIFNLFNYFASKERWSHFNIFDTNKNVKNTPDIIDCNLKKDDQILVIFGRNVPDTTGHQMTVQVPTSPNVCFCTTWEKQNMQNMYWNKQKKISW